MYFFIIFTFFIISIELRRVWNFFKRRKETNDECNEVVLRYPFICILALFSTMFILCNNFIFLDAIGIYKIESYPESTLYCYVSLTNDKTDIIYPCKIYKYVDNQQTTYYLDTIFFPNSEINLSDQDISISPDKYETKHFSDSNDQSYEVKMKLISIKYKQTENISNKSKISGYINLIIAALNLVYVIDFIRLLLNEHKKFQEYNKYFKVRFGHLCNPVTNKNISDIKSYIDALNAHDELTNN